MLTEEQSFKKPPHKHGAAYFIVHSTAVIAFVGAIFYGHDAITAFAQKIGERIAVNDAPQTSPVQTAAPDQERFRQVATIRIALVGFYAKHGAYPATLSQLMPDFLADMPHDPQTGAMYPYASDTKTFSLHFTLTTPVAMLAPGTHLLSPDGFDARKPPVPPQIAPPPPDAVPQSPASSTDVFPSAPSTTEVQADPAAQ